MQGKIYEVYEVSANFVYFVCLASPDAILSQPAADSSFPKEPLENTSNKEEHSK